MKHLNVAIAAAAIALTASAPAQANEYLTGSIGYHDIIDKGYDSTQLGLEYRFNSISYGLRPIVGVTATTDKSAYAYAGVNLDVPILSNQLYLIPNFAAGAYHAGDDGKDLGGAIEFRSGLEIAYQMENFQRIGIAFNHTSNAGIYDKNPGVETLMLTYSIPAATLLGN